MYKYMYSFLVICFSLSIISCDNEPLEGDFGEANNDVEDPNENATFEVRLDETLYVGEDITAILDQDGLLISGRNGNQEFSITIAEPATGNYVLSNSSENVFITYTANRNVSQPFYTATSGELTITNYNEEIGLISGNFEGILSEFVGLAEDIEMTNGIFDEIRFVEVTEVEVPGDGQPGDGEENPGDGEGGGEDGEE